MLSTKLTERLFQPTFPLSQEITSSASRMDKVIKELKKSGPVLTLEDDCSEVWACALTASKDILYSSSKDYNIKVWNLNTKDIQGTLSGHQNIVNSLSLIKKDSILISADWDGKILIWDTDKREILSECSGHKRSIFCLFVAKDENFFYSGSSDKTVRKWDLESFSQVNSINCEECSIHGLTYLEKLKWIIAGGSDENLWVMDAKDLKLYMKLEIKRGYIQCLTASKFENYIIIGTRKNLIILYNLDKKRISNEFSEHTNWVRGLTLISNDLYLISFSADKTMRIYDMRHRKEETWIKASEGYIYNFCLSNDNETLVTVGAGKLIRFWNISSSKRYFELKKTNEAVESVTITKDEKFLVSGLATETIQIWSLETKQLVKNLENERQSIMEPTKSDIKKIFSVEVTNDQKHLVSITHDGRLTVWNFETYSRIQYLTQTANAICPVVVSNNSQYAFSASRENSISIWDLTTLDLDCELAGHSDIILNIKVDSQDQILISHSTDSKLIIWNLPNRQMSQVITISTTEIRSIALSQDRKFFALGGPSVILWQWETKSKIKAFTHHKSLVKYVEFSPDSNYLISCGADSTVRLWNTYEEKHELVLRGHSSTIRRVLFMNSMNSVISAGDDSRIIIWQLSSPENELADVGESIDSFCFKNKIINKSKPSVEDCSKSFSNLRINLTHIYAYLGYQELLRFALENGAEIKTDADGHSALFYCIQRECQYCVDTIIKYLIELKRSKTEKFIDYAHAFHNEFHQIISNHSIYLPEFLEAIFYTIPDQPNFGVPMHHLPFTYYSDTKVLNSSIFIHDPDKLDHYYPEKTLEFKTMPFPIPCIRGSKESLDLLSNICNCKNLKIFETKFIKDFVSKKWDNIWLWIFVQTILMWINVFWMVLALVQMYTNNLKLTTNSEYHFYLICFLVTNLILFIYEILQLITTGTNYFHNAWNWIDVARSISCLLWAVLSFIFTQDDILFITWIMAFINLFRGLSSFKAFQPTRFYTRLIIFAFFQSLPFLVIFFYSTFMFGIIYLISKEGEEKDILNIWNSPYHLSMGDIEISSDDSWTTYIYFMMATVINVIIMLNLLVSILGDSFDSFQMDSKQIDCLEMAELVLEFENLYFFNRDKSDKKYIHLCQEHKEEESHWEGRIKVMMTLMKSLKLEMRSGMQSINDKIDLVLTKVK